MGLASTDGRRTGYKKPCITCTGSKSYFIPKSINKDTVYLRILNLRQKIQRAESNMQINVRYILNQSGRRNWVQPGSNQNPILVQMETLPINIRSSDDRNLK